MRNEVAIFGGGCFWCTEAVFSQLKGVMTTVPGYSGDKMKNPTYDDICGGKSGYVEVAKVEFNPQEISYSTLLAAFFATHDPTTIDRQGNDIGHQYKSVIFHQNSKQKKEAEEFIEKLKEEKIFSKKIVTEIRPAVEFYPAEEYHLGYYQKNSQKPYCQFVINPKLDKLREKFGHLLK